MKLTENPEEKVNLTMHHEFVFIIRLACLSNLFLGNKWERYENLEYNKARLGKSAIIKTHIACLPIYKYYRNLPMKTWCQLDGNLV